MNKNLLMLVVAHKETTYLPADRSVIKVGNNDFQADYSDNLGDNISAKNSNYCELTALYYAWRNLYFDYLSFEHYRRFFYFKNREITKAKILELLNEYDLILPKAHYVRTSTFDEYVLDSKTKEVNLDYLHDLDVLREVFLEKHPEDIKTYDDFFSGKKIYYYNMFAGSKKFVDEYCNWLFDILFEVEKRIDISSYDSHHARIFGFLSERLFNVYVMINKDLKIKELEVVMPGQSKSNRIISNLKNKIKSMI